MLNQIIIHREEYDRWIVFNKLNGKVADIIKISEYGNKSTPKFRVDYKGKTKISMVTFNKAKFIAKKLVNEI